METSCLCKAVIVKVSKNWLDGEQHGQVCHCYNCRKVSGTGMYFLYVTESGADPNPHS